MNYKLMESKIKNNKEIIKEAIAYLIKKETSNVILIHI
jgi:hypothetical protein